MSSVVCKFCHFANTTAITATVMFMVTVAIDKFYIWLRHLETSALSKGQARVIIFVLCAAAAAWASQKLFAYEMVVRRSAEFGGQLINQCSGSRSVYKISRYLTYIHIAVFFLASFATILFCYSYIVLKIWNTAASAENVAVIRMLVFVVISCFIGQAPINILRIYFYLGGSGFSNPMAILVVLEFISYTNSWMRVAIVLCFNKHIVQAVRELPCLAGRMRKSRGHSEGYEERSGAKKNLSC